MKHRAWPALVLGVAFACGGGRNGGEEGQPSAFGSDASVETPTSCKGTVRCSRDLRSIVDGCDESRVLTTCAPEEGCGGGRCVPACDAAVSANATMGCEFVPLPPTPDRTSRGGCFAAVLTNTWATSARIEAEYEGQPLEIEQFARIVRTNGTQISYEAFTGQIQPGEVIALFLSQATSGANNWVPCPTDATPAITKDTTIRGTKRGTTFRIKTTAPVSAYSFYPFGGSSGGSSNATILLPIASWKANYLITTPSGMVVSGSSSAYYPTTHIVAAEDDTEVTILPSVDIAGGLNVDSAVKGTAHVYRMQKSEQIQFMQEHDLTGTRISANKPVGVWAGHEDLLFPPRFAAHQDPSQTELFPVSAWGQAYVLAPYTSRSPGEVPEEYFYRVTAAVDGTVLTYEPRRPKDAPASLAAGESILFGWREPFIVRSQDIDHPFAVYAYMTAHSYANAVGFDGDPEFVAVVPTEQYLSRYVFLVDPKYSNSQLVVVRSRPSGKEFEPVVLDCVGTLEGWSPVGTSGEHEFTRVWLTRRGEPQTFGANTCGGGRYTMESKGPIAVTVWGTDQFTSYAYPGGAALRTLNGVELIVK